LTRRADPHRVDARGLKCPWPVLRAARAMRAHRAIVLLADDPVARVDVPALARANGWSITVEDFGRHTAFALATAAPEPDH
jgi:tRNA 2-thiouridine synthesizing protein A